MGGGGGGRERGGKRPLRIALAQGSWYRDLRGHEGPGWVRFEICSGRPFINPLSGPHSEGPGLEAGAPR